MQLLVLIGCQCSIRRAVPWCPTLGAGLPVNSGPEERCKRPTMS